MVVAWNPPVRRRWLSAAVSAAALTTSAVVYGATASGASETSGAAEQAVASTAATLVSAAPQPVVTLYQRVQPPVTIERRGRDDRVSEKGGDLVAASALGSFDVPEAALRAYRRAAASINAGSPECRLPWTLLAGIGRVESDHGRYGGSVLGSDGRPRPEIRGVALDGVGPVAAIRDSDGGRLDGDKVWDRAVGPMQFIPTTWAVSGRDGDGDGVADPHDLDDAALAAAGYLCPSSGSIRAPGAMERAVFSYNHSDYYVDLVLAFEAGYRTGSFAIPSPPPPDPQPAPESSRPGAAKPSSEPSSKPSSKPVTRPASSAAPRPKPRPKPKPAPKPQPTAEASPKPTPKPKPKPAVTPSSGPTAAPPSPVDAVEVTGTLTRVDGVWRLDERRLRVDGLQERGGDLDGDGAAETREQELHGLLDQRVTIEYVAGTDPWRVVTVEGLPL